jgi:hypothetical protein
MLGWLGSRWAQYKYRFTPWLALTLARRAVRRPDKGPEGAAVLEGQLGRALAALHQYSALREDLALYHRLHHVNQVAGSRASTK